MIVLAPRRFFAGKYQFNGGTHQTRDINTGVIEEVIILCGQEGMHLCRGDFIDIDGCTPLVTEFSQNAPVT